MSSGRTIIVIPSRLSSTRLPNKPLVDICGKSMIMHVYERSKKAGFETFVAAADDEIITEVESYGGKAIKTDEALPSGTDRVFQAIKRCVENGYIAEISDNDIVINVQGDLPLVSPKLIANIANAAANNNQYDIVTAVSVIDEFTEVTDPNCVKAVIANYNAINAQPDSDIAYNCLYFSRCSAPYDTSNPNAAHGLDTRNSPYFHHIGIYAYRFSALERFINLPESPLEKREKLEQLRALENNMKIGAILSSEVPLGVDTQADLDKVRAMLK